MAMSCSLVVDRQNFRAADRLLLQVAQSLVGEGFDDRLPYRSCVNNRVELVGRPVHGVSGPDSSELLCEFSCGRIAGEDVDW